MHKYTLNNEERIRLYQMEAAIKQGIRLGVERRVRRPILERHRGTIMKLVNNQYRVKTTLLTDDIEEEIKARLALVDSEYEMDIYFDMILSEPPLDIFMESLPEASSGWCRIKK